MILSEGLGEDVRGRCSAWLVYFSILFVHLHFLALCGVKIEICTSSISDTPVSEPFSLSGAGGARNY